jgi:hypothetical protein
MSDGTATISVTAKESKESSATAVLAIDLWKFESVACRYDPASGVHAFEMRVRRSILVERLGATNPYQNCALHPLVSPGGERI